VFCHEHFRLCLRRSLCVAGIFLSVLAASNSAQSQEAPPSVFSCEGDPCGPAGAGFGTWTFEASRGHASWAKLGIQADLSVERFDAEAVIIHRKDTAGLTVGASAVYRGKLNGPRVDGTVEYSWPEHFDKPKFAPWFAVIDPKVAPAFLANLKPAVINSGANQAIAALILSGEYFTTTPGNWGSKIAHPIRITRSGKEFSIVKLVTGSAAKAQDARPDREPFVRGTFDENGTAARIKGIDGNWMPTTVLLVSPDHVRIGAFDFVRYSDIPLADIPCDPNNPLHVEGDFAWLRSRPALKDKNQDLYLCWVRISALDGLRDGQSAWGYALLTGNGVPRDVNLGFQFTEKAAHQGDFRGQINLSRLFAAGVGTERNEELAEYWFHVASRNADAPASLQNAEGLRIFQNVMVGLLHDAFVRDSICDAPDPSSGRDMVEQQRFERQRNERDRRIREEGLDCSSHALSYLMAPD